MRSEFEAWAMSVMNPNLDRYGDGQYRAPHIEIAWSAWQAATKAASEVCMEWRAGCDNRSMQGEGWAAAECAQAIMARMEMPNAEASGVRSEPFEPATTTGHAAGLVHNVKLRDAHPSRMEGSTP